MSARQLKKLYFLNETYKEDNKILKEIVDSLCKLSVITLLVEVLLKKLDFNISGIDWRLSNCDGRGPAEPEAGWCWAFAYTKDGRIRRETVQLVQALDLYGNVRVGQYKTSFGGRDGNLQNRTKVKK